MWGERRITSSRSLFLSSVPWLIVTMLLVLGLALGYSSWTADTVAAAPVVAPFSDVSPGCVNLIPSGQFEQISADWQIQSGDRPPTYSMEQAFDGVWSMRVGNALDLPNVESVSEIWHKPVLLPYGATSIILRFMYWPLYESAPGVDLQQADLFNATTNQLILPLLNVQDNRREWKLIDYDLTAYAGQEVSLRFRVRNDGIPGRTLMYIDSVEIEYCAATPIPTFTPSPVTPSPIAPAPTTPTAPAPTFTPTPVTLTPEPTWTTAYTPVTATPSPTINYVATANPTCQNILINSGFEQRHGWIFGQDPVPGEYTAAARLSGVDGVQLGNPPGHRVDQPSFSSIRQLVTIPYGVTSAELRWWKLLRTEQPGAAGMYTDRQDLVLLDPALNTLAVPKRELVNDGVWREDVVDLTGYRGKTFYVYFNAYNDGNGARTWMYLDDIQLNVCGNTIYGGGYVAPSVTTIAPLAQVVPVVPPAVEQLAPPTLVVTIYPTPSPTVPIELPTATPPVITATVTIVVEPTSNVYALGTPTASFLIEPTPTIALEPATLVPDSGITTQPPAVVTPLPTAAASQPLWVERLGPITVLLGVLVLIGFIVWAILRTFRGEGS